MRSTDQIRRCRQLGLWILLCFAVPAFSLAQTETTTPPGKPSQISTAPAAKSKHRTSAHSAKKHTPAQTSAHTSAKKSGKSSRGKKGSRKRGQQVIDSARAREIQDALIREHYLEGEPSGKWDSATQAAMQRYQTNQGWQSKTIPDSRALIKLGLGPSTDHLLNPESAMTSASTKLTDPRPAPKSDRTEPPAHAPDNHPQP